MTAYTIHEANYEAVVEICGNLGVFMPRIVTPMDEYPLLHQGREGLAALNVIRLSVYKPLDVHGCYQKFLEVSGGQNH